MQTLLSAFGSSVLCFDFTFFSTFAPPPSAKMLPKPKPFGFGLALISCTSSLFVSSAEATRHNVALPSSHCKIWEGLQYTAADYTTEKRTWRCCSWCSCSSGVVINQINKVGRKNTSLSIDCPFPPTFFLLRETNMLGLRLTHNRKAFPGLSLLADAQSTGTPRELGQIVNT